MAKKKEVSKEILGLKKEITEGKVILGTKSVLKNLKIGLLSKVYLASNCPPQVKKDIAYYAGLVKLPVVVLKLDNEGLSVLCKKHFFISVLGVKRR